MPGLALVVCGMMLPHLLRGAPPDHAAVLVAVAGVLALTLRPARSFAFLLLPMAFTLFTLNSGLRDRLDPALENRETFVDGRITSMPVPRGTNMEFLFEPMARQGSPRLPSRIRVRWYREQPDLRPGETWRLHLRLRPPRGRVNFSGPDTERWYFAEKIGALATVVKGGNERLAPARGAYTERARQLLRARILNALQGHSARGLVLALAIADRSELAAGDWESLAVTGTGHLLAISGMHIGLAALFGFWMGRLCSPLLPARARLVAGLAPAWACAFAVAACYAALAAFGASTVRALIMLMVVYLAILTRRQVHPSRPFFLALAGVLLVDPLAPLRAGFWLSFAAVGVLLALFSTRGGAWGRWRTLLYAQTAITLIMLPFGMYWFQQGTLAGLAANLVAIPWISLVVVPLVLAGCFLALFEAPLAGMILNVAADAAAALSGLLSWASPILNSGVFRGSRPGLPALAMAAGGVLVLLLARGVPARWLAPFMLAPVLLNKPVGVSAGEALVEVLDVGQGLAVLVTTRGHLALYDSGPGQPGAWDLVRGNLAPAVAAAGFSRPDRVIISHGDLDHAGGLAGVERTYSNVSVFANLGRGTAGCSDSLQWEWDGVRFRVLHPTPNLPYLGNASSCVLELRTRHGPVLLTGDIDAAVEARLLSAGIGRYPVIVAPHHGSRTSSTEEFVGRVAPALALFSAGAGNRFGFPHPQVLERYANAGALNLSTSDCGAIRVRFAARDSPRARTARRHRQAMWRWPAAPHCP